LIGLHRHIGLPEHCARHLDTIRSAWETKLLAAMEAADHGVWGNDAIQKRCVQGWEDHWL
jgi:hypothetical protein